MKNILVVEDDEMIISLFKRKLRNHNVIATDNPFEAITKLCDENYHIDVVFLDFWLNKDKTVNTISIAECLSIKEFKKKPVVVIHAGYQAGAMQLQRTLGEDNCYLCMKPAIVDHIMDFVEGDNDE